MKQRFITAIFTLLIVGCTTTLEPQVVSHWNKAKTGLGMLGTWKGVAPNGDQVTYVFNQDLTCSWEVASRKIPCEFKAGRYKDGIRLLIYKMEGEQFEDVEFLAWMKVQNNKMMVYGYPTKYQRLQSGAKAEWPKEFTGMAILLTYQ